MRPEQLIQAFQLLAKGAPLTETALSKVQHVTTFEECGEDSADDGVVLTMTDGSSFSLPIRCEHLATGDFPEADAEQEQFEGG